MFTPDGKRALATKFSAHKVALLDVDGDKVTYNKFDMPAGLWPYNVDVTPNGQIALTSDNGAAGSSDGNVDTTSVIDLEAKPPRVIDRVVVGDGPEGVAIQPEGQRGGLGRSCAGSNNKPAYFYHRNGHLTVLRIDGKKVTKTQGDRGRRIAGSGRVHAGRQLSLCRQLSRQGHLDPARQWRRHHRYRQAL